MILDALPAGAIVLGVWVAFALGIGLLVWLTNWATVFFWKEKIGELHEEIRESFQDYRYTMPWVIRGPGGRRLKVKQKVPPELASRCPVCGRRMIEESEEPVCSSK